MCLILLIEAAKHSSILRIANGVVQGPLRHKHYTFPYENCVISFVNLFWLLNYPATSSLSIVSDGAKSVNETYNEMILKKVSPCSIFV